MTRAAAAGHASPAPGADARGGIVVEGLRKRFGPVQALDGVDLTVRPGELVTLLGPNGAGKSTLLRSLGALVLPDAGRIEVAGTDVRRDPVGARRAMGLVLGDERSWYWRLTGRQNLELFAVLCGLRRRDARRRAGELLELVALTDAADRMFFGYSAGMRARLSLARALVVMPPVLLLDEPTRTLDPLVALEFRDVLIAVAREHGAAVLWATHDLHEAAAVADRVLVLHAGRVVADEPRGRDAEALERLLTERVTAWP